MASCQADALTWSSSSRRKRCSMGPHSARCRPKAASRSALPALDSVSGASAGNSARYSPRTRGAAGRHSPAGATKSRSRHGARL